MLHRLAISAAVLLIAFIISAANGAVKMKSCTNFFAVKFVKKGKWSKILKWRKFQIKDGSDIEK